MSEAKVLLSARGIQRRFGGLLAVDIDNLEVRQGRITALIGPNGAGKSTLFNILTGFDRADSGAWHFDGEEISGTPAHRLARRGLVRTFQLTKSLADLTVEENMLLAAPGQHGEGFAGALLRRTAWKKQEKANRDRANELLRRFGLEKMVQAQAGVLSGGQRKLLELSRALMTNPRMLLLDEPMAGVNPRLVETLLQHMLDVRDEGTTLLFVEHDMDVVAGMSDDVVCMATGRILAVGDPSEVMRSQAVIDAYLGVDESGEPGGTTA